MSYDLSFWPVDRSVTFAEAAAEIARLDASWRLGFGHDKRLDPFVAEVARRYPALLGQGIARPPFELNVHRKHVFVALGWADVEAVAPVISEIAWRTGLAVYDPQRLTIGLPRPLAEAPLGGEGIEEHVATAEQVLGAIVRGAAMGGDAGGDVDEPGEETTHRAISEQLRSIGATQVSPYGFEVTPDIEAEYFRDPNRIPTSLQTPSRKTELLAELEAARPGDRHRALLNLAAWDADPKVAAALRPILASDDVFEAGQAASGLARQGDITDLPALLDLVHRVSPADGGTTESMVLPLRAALDLAAQAGPEIVSGVKGRAREWRGPAKIRRQSWQHQFDAELDALLAE